MEGDRPERARVVDLGEPAPAPILPGQDDLARSLSYPMRATAAEQAPVDALRSLGLVHKQRGDAAAAVQAFEKYLVLAPDAPDVSLLKAYLAELKP